MRLRKKQAAAAAKCASKKAAPKQAHAGEKRPLQPGGAGAANARPPGMCRICARCDAVTQMHGLQKTQHNRPQSTERMTWIAH